VDLDRNGQTELLFAERRRSGGGGIRALMGKDTTPADGQADLFFATPLTRDSSVAVCVTDSLIAVADRTGLVYFLTRSGVFLDSTSALPAGEAVVGLSGLPDGPRAFIVAGSSGTVAVVSAVGASGNRAAPVVVNLGAPLAGPVVSAKFQTPAGVALRFAVTSTDGRLFLLDPTLRAATGFPVSLASPVSGSPAFADVDGDGVRDVIVTAGGKLHALNWAGVSLDFFPLAAPGNDTFTGNPVIGDADGDGTADVICGTGSGAVVAMTRRGETVRGFPLAAGIGVGTPLVASSGDSILVAAPVSEGGAIAGWVTGRSATPTLAAFPWTQERHDAARTGFDPSTPVPPSTSREFFPSERAYNWPNPVYDGQTFIRYFVNESAAVRIRIFDLAGALVAELAAHGVAGVDNEVAWNVQDVQSGVYLARIEARGAATIAHAIVKIAVVK
jgi:Tfp pilus assembly protein PilZ